MHPGISSRSFGRHKLASVRFGDVQSDADAAQAELDAKTAATMRDGPSWPAADDGQPAVFKDSDGFTYSQAQMDALAEGDTSGWSPTEQQMLVDSVNQDNAEAAATGQSVAAVKQNNAAAASNPLLSSFLAGLGIAGGEGVAYLKANPSMVPSSIQGLIPGFSVTPPPKVNSKPRVGMSTGLILAGIVGLGVVGFLLYGRK